MYKDIFKTVNEMNEKDKEKFSEMVGKIVLWIIEGRSTAYMAENLNMHPEHVNHNIDELLYSLKVHVGKWHFFKMLFMK